MPDLKCILAKYLGNCEGNDVIQIYRSFGDTLGIAFQRTVRVPDGKGEFELPPALGTFPLYLAAGYQRTFPNAIAAKGGVLFPMYRKSGCPDRLRNEG